MLRTGGGAEPRHVWVCSEGAHAAGSRVLMTRHATPPHLSSQKGRSDAHTAAPRRLLPGSHTAASKPAIPGYTFSEQSTTHPQRVRVLPASHLLLGRQRATTPMPVPHPCEGRGMG
ncbi:MAG: hypothetical protein WDW38_002651 [Sanguina aurantia]